MLAAERGTVQIRDGGGDPTPAGLAAGGAVVVVVATGGAAAAAESSNWIAPIIALVGAVFVAVLTAITTNRRQAKQLAAEEERLRRELAHQRDLGELAHLREFFDDLAAAFEQRVEAVTEWATFVRSARTKPSEEEEAPEGFTDASGSVLDATARMAIAMRRLGLRLPVDHEVTSAYFSASEALSAQVNDLNAMYERTAYDWFKQQEHSQSAMAAWRRWVDAARSELDRRAAATDIG